MLKIFQPNEAHDEVPRHDHNSLNHEILYAEVFAAADWLVKTSPWKAWGDSFECESDDGAVMRLIRNDQTGIELHFESQLSSQSLRLISSDLLHGLDYELNVRFAPESWDEEVFDVLIFRNLKSSETIYPDETGLHLIRDCLNELKLKNAD